MVAKVLLYGTRICPYCRMAERLLEKRGVQAEKVMVDQNPARREEMVRLTGRTSVPQIFIGARCPRWMGSKRSNIPEKGEEIFRS